MDSSNSNAFGNAIKLAFAKENLTEEQFEKLYKSYKRLFWFQLAPAILLALAAILIIIFMPSASYGQTDWKTAILLFGSAFFIFPFLPIWLVLSQFLVGKLWHSYSKWFKKSNDINELYALFK
ncbi:hypothetical protein LJC18_01620 [Lachnospiraceae bacterium OttesenSCG-928-E19]|nr:hypothetical protein [Lachnospiraceae bacterium OttesenSCG-928-E19]